MRVIIAGGTGLIGTALVRELQEKKHIVILLSRNPARHAEKFPDLQIEHWDARSNKGWGHLANQVDAIVNLAGENLAGTNFFPVRWTPERKAKIVDSRLQAGAAVSAAVEAAENKPKVVVQSSAIGYYGVSADKVFTEDDHPGNDFVAQTSQQWEASTASVEPHGVRRVIIRTGIVLDQNDGALMRLLLPYRLFAGGPFGDGKQCYSWIHLKDQAAAIRFLLENDQAQGVFNLTAPNPLTNAEFGKALGRVMKRPSWLPVPGFVFRLLFGEVATVVLDGQRVLPQRLQGMGFEFQFPDIESAFRDILRK
jgi:uncharacterized protein